MQYIFCNTKMQLDIMQIDIIVKEYLSLKRAFYQVFRVGFEQMAMHLNFLKWYCRP